MKKIFILMTLLALLTPVPADAQTAAPASGNFSLPPLSPIPATPAAPADTATTLVKASAPTDPGTAFAAGVSAYEAGNFAKACDNFAAAERSAVSPSFEYNFGNACFQTGDYGAAILHYLRTLSLAPRNPDARQNLALARQAANLTTPEPIYLARVAECLNENSWTWVATIAGWATLYLAFLPRLYRWRGAAPWLLCASAAMITIIGSVGLWGARQHEHEGVVLHADTPLKISPTATSQPIGMVQSGEVAQTLRVYNGNYYVRMADGHLGWIDQENYAPVWD